MEIQGRSLNNPAKLAWNGIIAIDGRFEELVITDSRLVLHGFQPQNSMEALFDSLQLPKAKINFTQQKMGIPALEFQIGELKVLVSGLSVVKAMTKPSASAVVNIVKFYPKQVATRWRVSLPVTRDDNAVTELAATFRLYANLEVSEINQLYGKLDSSYFSGKLKVNNFKKPKLSYDISADKLNLERYFGDKERPDMLASQVSPRIAFKLPAPLGDDLKRLNLDGKFRASQLTVKGVTMKDIHFRLISNRGKINVETLSRVQ